MNVRRAGAGVVKFVLAAGFWLAFPAAHAGSADAPRSALTAQQIVDRSIEVQGGLQAWGRISTLIWEGHLESQRSSLSSLPFRLEEKRPGKSRFEITEPSQRSLRVFNGVSGWKMKFSEDGRPELKQFSAQEIRFARSAPGLEGPVVDLRERGGTLELQGTENLEGRKTYRIGVRLATGEQETVWIDAETFLEFRYDRVAYGPSGPKGNISVRYRDFKEVEGLAVPSVIEIGGAAGGTPDRMIIDRVALNPPIEDREFDGLGDARGRAAVESGTAPR